VTAYVLVDVEVTGMDAYNKYKVLAPPTIAQYGGRYLARGGRTVVLEGDMKPNRVVVLEFPTLEAAQTWYDSPEYRTARRAREGGCNMQMLVVEGA
jgi:uncharacterized protein (DUF1330 family)